MKGRNSVKVSVIIPIYNGEKWLADCLDSVIRQSFEDFEVIAINDGSRDGSALILADYARRDGRLRAITTENHGVSATRNLGLEQAKGEYIRFMDCDDSMPDNSLEKLVRAAQNADSDLVIGAFQVWGQGREIKRTLMEREGTLSRETYLAHLKQYPRSFYYSVLWNKLYRRDIIQEQGLRFDESLTWSEDFLFNIHYLAHVSNVSVLTDPVYSYRHHASGLTYGFAKKIARHPLTSIRLIGFLFRRYCTLCLQTGKCAPGDYGAFFRGTHSY